MNTSLRKTPRWDVLTCSVIVVACSILVYDALELPPGSFEPLGSGFMPRVLGLLVIGLSVLVALGALSKPAPEASELPPDLFAGMSMTTLTIAAATLFQSRAIDFGILMAAFIFAGVMALEHGRRAAILPAAITGITFGFGMKYVFTRIFVVDLPVWF
ncbi:Tripartite tricarboxylate transporter TctB family protein [Marinovum algicola]|uniref:Tripartite tricarboxylate transporter TctB family protein n=2 Tax=Marinovum algicola TaxID=42444 RepID=A0A975ZR41_9RHOB|nr:Tripartite tricarboxylate transporter TctB family protein [Marinovum algicola]SLN71190.1 Tripartite tricarboxylate transporter TctB family protein [Marinovum algicola]